MQFSSVNCAQITRHQLQSTAVCYETQFMMYLFDGTLFHSPSIRCLVFMHALNFLSPVRICCQHQQHNVTASLLTNVIKLVLPASWVFFFIFRLCLLCSVIHFISIFALYFYTQRRIAPSSFFLSLSFCLTLSPAYVMCCHRMQQWIYTADIRKFIQVETSERINKNMKIKRKMWNDGRKTARNINEKHIAIWFGFCFLQHDSCMVCCEMRRGVRRRKRQRKTQKKKRWRGKQHTLQPYTVPLMSDTFISTCNAFAQRFVCCLLENLIC